MSSGTTAEPIQPEAPVTKMRMEGLLGCAAGEGVCAAQAPDRNDAIQSH
jgi:hypothetical protein